MSDSIKKFGEAFLNLSHAKQIEFTKFKAGDALVAEIHWADGTHCGFQGETTKALLSYVDPDEGNGPETIGRIDQDSLIETLGVSTATFRRWRTALGVQVKKYYSDSEKSAFLDLKTRLENKEGFDEAISSVLAEHLFD